MKGKTRIFWFGLDRAAVDVLRLVAFLGSQTKNLIFDLLLKGEVLAPPKGLEPLTY